MPIFPALLMAAALAAPPTPPRLDPLRKRHADPVKKAARKATAKARRRNRGGR